MQFIVQNLPVEWKYFIEGMRFVGQVLGVRTKQLVVGSDIGNGQKNIILKRVFEIGEKLTCSLIVDLAYSLNLAQNVHGVIHQTSVGGR